MNRLQSELRRLYLHQPQPQAHADADAQPSALIDASGTVRAMVMALTRAPSWELLSRVWRGVQTELALPAPAIAVSGTDALQLWFSLETPIAVAQARAFLAALRARFLPEIESGRVELMPASARLVPALQEQTGNWSAFVAPDLAPVFGDTPWLDIPPGEEGQAALLSGLKVTAQSAFETALKRLEPSASRSDSTAAVAPRIDAPLGLARPTITIAEGDPKRFLLQVMNDDSVALALRIEAAKALLQHSS